MQRSHFWVLTVSNVLGILACSSLINMLKAMIFDADKLSLEAGKKIFRNRSTG